MQMERKASTIRSDLEQMLLDETTEPKVLPLSLLEDITSDFSHDQEIGSGGFAVVYKGILGDRAVAVKRMSDACMDEMKFHRVVKCLMQVKHKNVVRFLGYCADRQGNMARYNGKLVMADVHQRLLCFKYIPQGSLDKYIFDTYRDWGTCYEIIKGICEGIQYLHENQIIHLDLKPSNIMLDQNMVPKITDFGLSGCFDENRSRHYTKTILGTMGYLAPELREGGVISSSADLYSLGVVIIEILTGQKGYQAIEKVLQRWSDRLERSQRETLCKEIRACYEMALKCRDFNPKKRPASVRDIIDRLHELENIQTAVAASSSSGVVHALAGQTVVMPFSTTAGPSGPYHGPGDDRQEAFAAASPDHVVSISHTPESKEEPRMLRSVSASSEPRHTAVMRAQAAPPGSETAKGGPQYGLTETKPALPAKLIYLKVAVIGAQDLIGSENGPPLAPTIVRIQMGSQIRRTRPGQPQGSANPAWNEEFMFVAIEPFEDPLVVTVEEEVAAGRDEPISQIIIPVASPYVPRNDLAKKVPSKWFNLKTWRGMMADEAAADVVTTESKMLKTFASKIHLKMSLEMAYHVLDEPMHYSSDLQPAASRLRKSAIGVLEVGILSARGLGYNKKPYCVAKYGAKWVRSLGPPRRRGTSSTPGRCLTSAPSSPSPSSTTKISTDMATPRTRGSGRCASGSRH